MCLLQRSPLYSVQTLMYAVNVRKGCFERKTVAAAGDLVSTGTGAVRS